MPANNPNFGTGAVDWGNYVGANQQTTDRDRGMVQSYLGQQPNTANQGANVGTGPTITGTAAQNTHVQLPGQSAQFPGGNVNPGSPVQPYTGPGAIPPGFNPVNPFTGQAPFGTPSTSSVPTQPQGSLSTTPDWSSMSSGLATPGGFEQALGGATHPGLTTPYGSLPANGPTATTPGAGNGFDAALEGQSAGSLYSTPAQQSKAFLQGAAATPPPPIKASGPIQSAPVIKAQGQTGQQAGQAGSIASDNWRKYLQQGQQGQQP